MAFTDVEMAILSQLAYSGATEEVNRKNNPSTAPKRDDRLYDLINENEEWLIAKLGDGYKDAIEGLKNKTQNADYVIVASEDDKDGTGFAAFAIRDPDNNVTVSCRGTEGFSLNYDSQKDVAADIELAYSLSTSQQEEMDRFLQLLESGGYDGYYFTGHSLGGNLATYGAIFLSYPEKLLGCVTFNAPGYNAAFLAKNQFRISRVDDRITSFQNERDCVSDCFTVIGNIVVLEFEGLDFIEILGFDAHSLNTLVISDNGSFKRNRTGRKDITVVGHLADYLTSKTDIIMFLSSPFTIPYDYFKWKNEHAQDVYRDFSSEAKAMLVGAATETEEEEWWEVTKWDCWYKVEQFFGTLEWDLYAGDVDSYYRKLIDINDASAKDIERIFESVYAQDSKYAADINIATDSLKSEVTARIKILKESIVTK